MNRWTNQFETLLLDVYEPAGDPAAARPAVVVVHGGGFKGGSKSGWRPEAAATAYARRGYVAVSIDYRLAPDRQTVQNNLQVVVQDASHDLKAAVRWLRSQAAVLRIDSARIASFGASAGAATVATSAYSASEGQSGNPGFSSEVACVTSVSGASLSLSELDAGDAPIFLVHGQQDTVVPPQGSVAVYQQALSVGVPTELHLLPGIDHSQAFMAFMQTRLDDAMAFSWQHLRLGALGGLQEIGSVSAPGTAVVRAVGIANDLRWFGVALALQQQPLPGGGDWWLDPASLILMPMTPFAEAPRLPSVSSCILFKRHPCGDGELRRTV